MAKFLSRYLSIANTYKNLLPQRQPINCGQCQHRRLEHTPSRPELPRPSPKTKIDNVISWRSVGIFGIVGTGLLGALWYVKTEKDAGKYCLDTHTNSYRIENFTQNNT